MQVAGAARVALERRHRPVSVEIAKKGVGRIVLRDQKPMPEDRLRTALAGTGNTDAWYAFLNGRVFFWANRGRVDVLLNARSYRHTTHDVLTINTRKLVDSYADRILLCHMNSGNTFPYPHKRDMGIFKTIATYEVRRNGNPLKPVAELTIDYSVPDLMDFVENVTQSGR